uniref:Matrin-type domain-containing protein n=1 Tax=Oryzias sinensis TaxID=183150 RepID=A0A8C7Y4C6_9TELE
MSHPLYNPYASGKQSSSQGQYGVPSGQKDPRLASPHPRPGSNFSSSGGSVGPIPSLLNLPTIYRPEKRATLDEDIERSVNLHISQAREGVKHQHPNQRSCFAGTSRNKLPSSVAGGTSYMSPSPFQGQRLSNVGSSSSTLDWLPIYNKVNQDNSTIFPSASSGFAVSGGGRFNPSGEKRRDMQSIPGLGDFEDATESKSTPPSEPSHPKYTSESAISILMNFGLEKEDLEHLISYPESQITPENLPFILREIRIKKAKSAPAMVQPQPYPEPQPTASRSRVDKLGDSRGSEMNLDCVSASILKPSKVIEYGHTGKYNAGGEVGKIGDGSAASNISAGMLRMDTVSGGSHSQDLQQRTLTEVKVNTSSVASCREQIGSSSTSSLRSSLAPSSSASTPGAPIQPSQYMFNMYNFIKKDTDMRQLDTDTSKALPVKMPEQSRPLTVSTAQAKTLTRGVHPQRPGLVVFDSNLRIPNAAQGENNPTPKRLPPNNPPKILQPKQQMDQMQQPEQIQSQYRAFSAVKPFPPPPVKPGGVSAPALHQQIPTLLKGVSLTPASSMQQSKMEACKNQPTEAMIRDYYGTTPKVFPHTCSICKKESAHVKDWISHHNTSLHLENCRLLRTRYLNWGGEVLQAPSPATKDPQPSPSTSAQNSQSQYQKGRWSSHSPSRSPRRQRGSEDRRNRRGSRSRSRSPRHRYSSDSRSEKHSSRSNSRSPRRRSENRREKQSRSRSPRSRHNRRSRTRSRSNSPRYSHYTSSRYRSRSRSRERRSSPRRKDERRSPRRSRERRSSPERSAGQRQRSSSTERLAKKLLEKTAAQSLSKHSDLEAMVKTLAPALLAELAKMKSLGSTSSAPSSSSGKHEGKSSPPTMVKLSGVTSMISHGDVQSATDNIGKTKSVVIFRSKLEAVVCFEKEEDAEKLRKMKHVDIKGTKIFVVSEKDSVAKETKEQNPPEHKSASSSDRTAQTGKEKEPAAASEGKKRTTAKPAAKAKVTVSKANAASTSKTAKTVKTKNSAKKTTKVKEDAPEPPGPKKTKVLAKTQTSKAKPTVVQKKTGKVTKPVTKTTPKASACKTAAADAKASAKTPQTLEPASQGSAGAEKTVEEKQKTETEAAGSPSGDAQTIKSEAVQILIIDNPLKPHEVKQEEPMEVEAPPGIKEVKGFGTPPPQTTEKSTPDEPPTPDKGSKELHQSSDPPKGMETQASHESSKVEPKQTDAEDALFVGKKEAAPKTSVDTLTTSAAASTSSLMFEDKIPKIDENVYKAFTAVLREHKKNKSSENKKDKKQEKVEVDGEGEGLSSSFFDEQNFNIEDFVTLDEIVGDVDNSNAHQTSTDKTEKKSKDEPSAAKKASCKSSSSTSSSKSTTSSSKSALTKNQNNSSESSKPSISAKASKTSSTSSSQSDSPPSKTSKQSPSPAGRTTRSSTAARKSEETSQKPKAETTAGKSAVTESDHSVSAESCAVKAAESETKIEPPSKVDSKHQMQSLRTDFKDETSKDEKKKDTKTKTDDAEHMKEMRDYGNDQNPEVQKDVGHPSNNEAPIPEDLQVLEMIKTENMTETENQSSEQTLLPEGKGAQVFGESDKPTAGNEMVLSKEGNQTPSTIESEGNVKLTEAETKTDESSKTSADSEQTSDDKEQPLDPVKEVQTLSHQQANAKEEATEEEDEVYHVLDAIEDLPTTTESETDINEEPRKKVGTGGQEDNTTRKSGQKSKTSSDEKEESQKKRDRKATKSETQIKKKSIRRDEKTEEDIEEDPEYMIFEVLDSVEDESVLEVPTLEMLDQKSHTGATEEKMSSVKGSPKSSKEEEDPEKKAGTDEQSVSTRSTRGRKSLNQDQAKEDISSRRSTPARESRGLKEKTPKTEDEAPLKERTPTQKRGDVMKDTSEDDTASSTLGAPEEDVVQKDQPPVQEKPRRGRPKKNAKKAKKQVAAPKKVESPVKEVEEDEDEFQIIDSVEEEVVDSPAFMNQTLSTGTPSSNDKTKPETTKGLLLNEEEEPLYQILDSVEDEGLQEEVTPTEVSNMEFEEDAKERSLIQAADSTAFSSKYQKCQLQSAETIKGVDGPSTELGEDMTQKTGAQTDGEPPSSQSADAASADAITDNDTTTSKNALKNLDEVSEEEEDYPDDTAEEEELNKRLAAAKERERAREERRATNGENREQKSLSCSRGRSHRSKEEEKVDLDTQELVTLDEVGGDEAGEPDFEGLDSGVMERELQDLVTLDEIIEEEVEEGKEAQTHETQPRIQDSQSEDLIKSETSAGSEESKSPRAAKRKHDEDAVLEESSNFGTIDDPGKTEEEEKIVTTPRSRGRPKKKSRQAAVRKSARGKESSTEEEKKDEELEPPPPTSLDSSSTPDPETSGSLGDDKTEIQKPEEDISQSEVQQLQPEPADEGKGSVMKNKQDELMTELKVNKRQQEPIGVESKRARSESPSVPASFLLPPYNPKSPIGQEHVVPKSGFFCNICSVFYLTEKAAKEVHCSSQRHYENLQKHNRKLQWKSSR